jgi:hypothetical protein
MMAKAKHKQYFQKRKYIRLETVFPVEFCLLDPLSAENLSGWLQGFTNNLSRGGICLAVNKLEPSFIKLIDQKRVRLALEIQMPLGRPAINATAKIVWMDILDKSKGRCLIGISYENIAPSDRWRIMRYAWSKKIYPWAVMSTVIFLFGVFLISHYSNLTLRRNNQALVEQLVDVLQRANTVRHKLQVLSQQRQVLEERLLLTHKKLEDLKRRAQQLEQERRQRQARFRQQMEELQQQEQTEEQRQQSIEKIRAINQQRQKELQAKNEELRWLVEALEEEKEQLETKLTALEQKKSKAAEDLALLGEQRKILEEVNLQKMYKWLLVHQNPRTGLVMSFEGDENIEGWAFIYDQALVSIAYTYFKDFGRAKKIFDFFQKRANRIKGGFANAYYVKGGQPAEYIVHTGPNIWLGIAILQYTQATQDRQYLHLAKDIAGWAMQLEKDGGLPGGPGINWFSTEHNLDAFAFFNMLYKISGRNKYKDFASRILIWLKNHVYDWPQVPVKRGKGDSTIATDTYAWSIAALGPQRLSELGMNPEKILEFAQEHCAAEVDFRRPSGEKVKVRGFDFMDVKKRAAPVISCEWTAQMILSYKILGDFYAGQGLSTKAQAYRQKAAEYLAQLGKLIISSPSASGQGEGCLPYATREVVNTGHGWTTPKGSSTGSVSSTAYALFAYYGFNPLELK